MKTKKSQSSSSGFSTPPAAKTSGSSDKKKSSSNKRLNQLRPPDNNETKRVITSKYNGEIVHTWNSSTRGWDPDAATVNNVTNGFWEACKLEFDTLTKKYCWEIVDRPKNRSVVSSTWAFRIKRCPDGSLRKLKARFCVRGFEQVEGIDFTETSAPIVNWTTVLFLLIMSILLGLSTKQVHYIAAFVQADITGWDIQSLSLNCLLHCEQSSG
jgi:hypothetical protein